MTRLDRIRDLAPGTDAIVLSALTDIRWATGFTGSNALLILDPDGVRLLTDGRYREQASSETVGIEVSIVSGPVLVEAVPYLASHRRIVVQGDAVTFADLTALQKRDALAGVAWDCREGLMRELRQEKDPQELAAITKAQALTEDVFRDVVGRLGAGRTESEIAAEIVHGHLRGGAEGMSFDPIVASGPNSALPHARPTERPVQPGELILIDIGCFRNGYASDMTRMVCLGEPSGRAREVLNAVTRALETALSVARAGIPASDLDASARQVIAEAGYGEEFSHSLGHGVGLEIHEAPRVSSRNPEPLPNGSVVTLEPGIYLPGEFGVRIEDMVVLHERGADRITSLPHDLVVL